MKKVWIAPIVAAGLLVAGPQAMAATACSAALQNHYVGAAPLDSQSWSQTCYMGPLVDQQGGGEPVPNTTQVDAAFGVTSTELTSFLDLGPNNATSGTWTIDLDGLLAANPTFNQFVLAIKDGSLGANPTPPPAQFFYSMDLLNFIYQPASGDWSGAWRIGAPIGATAEAKQLSGAYLFGWYNPTCCREDVPEPGTLALLGLGLVGLGIGRRRRG